MMCEKSFTEERKHIGGGWTADIYAWRGFAYKCFHDNLDPGFLVHENRVHRVIYEAGLPCPAWYPSDIPNSIKMGLAEGITLADCIRQGYKHGVEDLLAMFPLLHAHHGLDLPDLHSYLAERISRLEAVTAEQKQKALTYLAGIPGDDTLCHMDFHYLNILTQPPLSERIDISRYTVIDWASAMNGNPILDYARSYVITYEFAYLLSGKYLRLLKKEKRFAPTALMEALYVTAVHRLSEYNSPKVQELLGKLDRGEIQ